MRQLSQRLMAQKDDETAGEIALTGLWWVPQRVAPVRGLSSLFLLLPLPLRALPSSLCGHIVIRTSFLSILLRRVFYQSIRIATQERSPTDARLSCSGSLAFSWNYTALSLDFRLEQISMIIERKTFEIIRTKFLYYLNLFEFKYRCE